MADPVQISETIQEFNGRRYYRSKPGGAFASLSKLPNRQLISRAVWRDSHGNIPHGWEVHHKDRDRRNNVLSNLECLAPLDHHREHRQPQKVLLQPATTPLKSFICTVCGDAYEAHVSGGQKANKYCSRACCNRAYRRRRHV